MSPRLYSIKETIHEDDYLYEVVESGGQLGVRCRKYVLGKDLYGGIFDKYSQKEEYKIRKLVENRYPFIINQKFETIAWCWPFDHFDISTGKEIAKKRVDMKIELKKRKIKSFVKKIENHNLPKTK